MSRLPRLDVAAQDCAIVPFADAVQEMCVDLRGAALDGQARRVSQEFEQVITQIWGVNA